MRKAIAVIGILAIVAAPGIAADRTVEDAIRPISNPVFFDPPNVGTLVHPIVMHHAFPSRVSVDHPVLGQTTLPMGGDLQLYALQFEVALNEQVSVIAVKDGWIDFNPDATFTSDEGIGDLGAGLKVAFLQQDNAVMSARLVYEAPIGDDEVWQGNGDGSINPGISGLLMAGPVQLAGTIGTTIPLDDDEESTMLYHSWHASIEVVEGIHPLVEISHWRVLDEGGGAPNFMNQADGAVPAVARFEAGDLVNFGASHADDNADLVTVAVGCRVELSDNLDIGAAYEFPLTEEEEGLIDYRVTVDAVLNL